MLPVLRRFYTDLTEREQYVVFDLWNYATYSQVRARNVTENERQFMIDNLELARRNMPKNSFKKLRNDLNALYFNPKDNSADAVEERLRLKGAIK